MLEEAEAEFELVDLDDRGKLLLEHATHDIQVTVEYQVLPMEEIEPRGGVKIRFTRRGKDARSMGPWTHWIPFDEGGVADMDGFYGFWPLTFRAVFTRAGSGELSARIMLREGEP